MEIINQINSVDYWFQLEWNQSTIISKVQTKWVVQIQILGNKFLYYLNKKQLTSAWIFVKNYHGMILLNSRYYPSPECTLCTLCSQKNISSAHKLLKTANKYINTRPNSILLGIALSNLAIIYQTKSKYLKALNISLQVIRILEQHFICLKEQNKSHRNRIQDAVILVNGFIIANRVLNKLQRIINKTYYQEIKILICQIGYKYSIKYLGEKSIFTKQLKLTKEDKKMTLPIFYKNQQKLNNNYQKLIICKLQHIHNILNENFTQVVHQKCQKYPIMKSEQKITKTTTNKCFINDCEVIINLVHYQENNQNNNIYNKWQSLSFKCKNQKISNNYYINSNNLCKILKQLHFYDIIPYQYEINCLTQKQFINYCIIPFCQITNVKYQLEIHPKSRNLLIPFKIKFCNTNSIIGINHIDYNNLRIYLAPQITTTCLYLNIEICQISLQKYLYLQSTTLTPINKVYQEMFNHGQQNDNYIPFATQKQCQLRDANQFISFIKNIIKDFENFIYEYEQSNDITLQQIIKQNNNNYYKYIELNNLQGCFYYIQYISQINAFNIYLQNNFLSYAPSGKIKSKGQSLYEPKQFLIDFGIELTNNLLYFPNNNIFYDLILRKYSLKIFEQQLEIIEQEIYFENSIICNNFISGPFKIKCIMYENYSIPIVVQIIKTKNNYFIGIKVIIYDLFNLKQRSFFIQVTSQDWKYPIKQCNLESELNTWNPLKINKRPQEIYFIQQWLEKEGYDFIMNQIIITKQGITFTMNNSNKTMIKITDFIKNTCF